MVLADSDYQWFYWAAPIMAISGLAIFALLTSTYLKKVVLPKYRGKRVEE